MDNLIPNDMTMQLSPLSEIKQEEQGYPIPKRPSQTDFTDYSFETLNSNDCNMWDYQRMCVDEVYNSPESIEGPTLAQLNATLNVGDDVILENFNFDDIMMPQEGISASPCLAGPMSTLDINNVQRLPESLPNISAFSLSFPPERGYFSQQQKQQAPSNVSPVAPPAQKQTTLQQLLSQPPVSSRLSTSAPAKPSGFELRSRRSRKHLVSESSQVGSNSSISTGPGILSPGGVLSPGSHHSLSYDEGFDSDTDNQDSDSDQESNYSEDNDRGLSRRERYFWQYNVQSKGPKGQRLVLSPTNDDPHVLNEVTDPVFNPEIAVAGIRHSGKARRGDGNDLNPNPRKLVSIGLELEKLNQVINDLTPVSELPFPNRPQSRKEKNKLASRACRLKKKAQHEANKLKLYGLQHEHGTLLDTIKEVREELKNRLIGQQPVKDIEHVAQSANKHRIAGHTTDFVNTVVNRVKAGHPNGGLEEFNN